MAGPARVHWAGVMSLISWLNSLVIEPDIPLRSL